MKVDISRIDGRELYDQEEFVKHQENNLFIDRRKNSNTLLVVLAGYKSYLYEDVFSRLKLFAPKEMDVCIVSSGLYDIQLDEIARENNWSYLSTVHNCLTMAQNIAIMLHPKAAWLYKMDEDIFVTKHCFQTLMHTFQRVQNDNLYDVNFVAPLIPINGYGHVRILQKLGMVGVYERLFEKVKYAAIGNRMIGCSVDVAKFFWGEKGFIPSIDYMDEEFHKQEFSYSVCPVRFSIGFILMHRKLWEAVGGYPVPEEGSGMALDESLLNQIAITNSFAMIVSENTVVGHLSFGGQNEGMKEYHASHRSSFQLREN